MVLEGSVLGTSGLESSEYLKGLSRRMRVLLLCSINAPYALTLTVVLKGENCGGPSRDGD